MENICSVLPCYFYRSAARGAEIDLLIKMLSSEVWAVEVKHGLSPKLGRHYSNICDDVGADKKHVVYSGDDEFTVQE